LIRKVVGIPIKILIADDDLVSRAMLERILKSWKYEVLVACDGAAAWEALQRDDAPKIAILDWMMPEIDGVELCRRIRALARSEPTYLILLTSKHHTDDIVEGLDAGANDFITKPFDRRELQSRLDVARRMTSLQHDLAQRVQALEKALAEVKQLQGLLPICSYCKNVRNDRKYWQKLESYIETHTNALFSHGICPDCFRNILVPEMVAEGIVVDENEAFAVVQLSMDLQNQQVFGE
jgi:CheY-like chemotaxis protein